MGEKKSLGEIGEEYACEFLKRKGYRIVERNFCLPIGELDIVARDLEGTLVFIEVKTAGSFSDSGFHPEDHMISAKIKKFKKMASLYANAKKKMIRDGKGFRLDVIALSKVGNDFVVHHYENIS